MRRVDVVIGAGYGDEGKGLMTDCISDTALGYSKAVVRFNGGAQAGHTVVLKDGTRHVFSHFGSGSLRGIPTILSKFFVVNPTLFLKEAFILNEKIDVKGLDVYVSPDAIVTTPFDVSINQALELFRSNGRHGSCGIGFGETIERSLFPAFKITVNDLKNEGLLFDKLFDIYHNYVPNRLARLGITKEFLKDNPDIWPYVRDTDVMNIISDYVSNVAMFMRFIKVYPDRQVYNAFEHLIFEGAQGLLLDQDYGTFPHVTRSNTGLKNVMDILNDVTRIEKVNAHYLTRAYTTRHGAGPLENELADKPFDAIIDETNIRNDYQGHLRFAYLNIKQYADAVKHDILKYGNGQIITTATVTCCDQISQSTFPYYDISGQLRSDYINYALEQVGYSVGAICVYYSMGPTRGDLRRYDY